MGVPESLEAENVASSHVIKCNWTIEVPENMVSEVDDKLINSGIPGQRKPTYGLKNKDAQKDYSLIFVVSLHKFDEEQSIRKLF